MALSREGRTIAVANSTPASPEITTPGRFFTGSTKVSFLLPGPGQEIRYTLDESQPGPDSTFYAGPFSLDKTAVVKAITVARDWKFGKEGTSPVTETKFVRGEPMEPVKVPDLEPGLKASVHLGFWNTLPDFTKLREEFTDGVSSFIFPPATPGKGFGVVIDGYIKVPADGVYTFALRNDDAAKLWIDGQEVVDNDGAHVVRRGPEKSPSRPASTGSRWPTVTWPWPWEQPRETDHGRSTFCGLCLVRDSLLFPKRSCSAKRVSRSALPNRFP